ncbi:MAG: phosphoglucosamine mutase [Bacteroidota bacterium]
MALIKSISGFRGTIGGKAGDNLTPQDIVECTAAYGSWLLKNGKSPKVVLGRDARISGELVSKLVCSTLQCLGIHIVDLGLSTTPTVEMAVPMEAAGGGIILTASHNPKQWNALKLLNEKGEFISAQDGKDLLDLVEKGDIDYATVDKLGTYEYKDQYIQKHIDEIFKLPLVKKEAIKERGFKVVVDAINSTGAISIVPLLEQLGCEVVLINGEMTGNFAHNPEPLLENLRELCSSIESNRADFGIAVDPDVDRLCFVSEDGELFGEEYTLVAIADYVLQNTKGPTVSNLSSTQALREVTEKHGCTYQASAVGEVNVVHKMKEIGAVIGGEGNGGVIYPALHYGRDALVGVALMLSYLTEYKRPLSFLRKTYPAYHISKNKIQLTPEINLNHLLKHLEEKYQNEKTNTIDGLKIEFESDWIHLRKSNTEPIIRIYTESTSQVIAENLAHKIKADVNEILKEMVKTV